jgi:hypothetical protein
MYNYLQNPQLKIKRMKIKPKIKQSFKITGMRQAHQRDGRIASIDTTS